MRMPDSPTLRLGTSWPSDGEEHARGSVSFHYQKEACGTKNAHRQAKRLCSGIPRLKSGKKRLGMFGYKLSCYAAA